MEKPTQNIFSNQEKTENMLQTKNYNSKVITNPNLTPGNLILQTPNPNAENLPDMSSKTQPKKNLTFKLSNGLESNKYYDDIKDFSKMASEKEIKKIMIIGDMGLGKSTLCNKMLGLKFAFNEDDEETEYGELIRIDDLTELESHFKVSNTHESVTQKTGFVIGNYLGNENLGKVMVIDSPGLFDPKEFKYKDQKKLNENNQSKSANPFFFSDLIEKLVAMEEIHTIVMMLSPNNGGRIPLNVINTIRALDYMFEKTECHIMMNLAFAFSKCDEDNPRTFSSIKRRRKTEYAEIAKFLEKYEVRITNDIDQRDIYLLSNIDPDKSSIGQKDEFIELWKFFNIKMPIKTKGIKNPEAFIQNGKFFTIKINSN